MTTQATVNIDELQAGRELDRLVAVKVMGWEPTTINGHRTAQPPDQSPYSSRIVNPPHYSSDIAAAWRLVEHFKPLIRIQEPVGLAFLGHLHATGFLWSETPAPLLICRAALSAIE